MGYAGSQDHELCSGRWARRASAIGPRQAVRACFTATCLTLTRRLRTIILTLFFEGLLIGFWFVDHGSVHAVSNRLPISYHCTADRHCVGIACSLES